MTSPSAPVVRDVPDSPGRWKDRSGDVWEVNDSPLVAVCRGRRGDEDRGWHSPQQTQWHFKEWAPWTRLPDAEKPVEAKPVEEPKPPKCKECGESGDFPVRILGKRQFRVRKCDDCYLANEAGALPGAMDGHNDAFAERHKQAIADRLKGSIWSPVDYGPTARVVLARGGRR